MRSRKKSAADEFMYHSVGLFVEWMSGCRIALTIAAAVGRKILRRGSFNMGIKAEVMPQSCDAGDVTYLDHIASVVS